MTRPGSHMASCVMTTYRCVEHLKKTVHMLGCMNAVKYSKAMFTSVLKAL